MVCGLSYSEVGGSILYIEARQARIFKKDSKSPGVLNLTGHLGEVMKESAMIAHTCAKNFFFQHMPDSPAISFLETQDIHINVPEGAIPKVHFYYVMFIII